ncbi:MAG: fluoride efflux transporter CrcB [Methyloligellaceae bacterium]
MSILYAALGGAIGAASRFLVTSAAFRIMGPGFPWGTVVVNVAGSFLMGVLIVFLALRYSTSQELRIFLVTGILGGFTTFSAFSLDFVTLFEQKNYVPAAWYLCSSVLLSILALFVGMIIARQILQ